MTARLRKIWIPLVKTGVSSLADTASDMSFYLHILENNDPGTNVYLQPLLFFVVVSVCILFLMEYVLALKGSHYSGKGKKAPKAIQFINELLYMEIFFKNIPQYALVALCTANVGELTAPATLKLTTATFNLFYNLMDIITPLEEYEHSDGKYVPKYEDKEEGDLAVFAVDLARSLSGRIA
mmetsp:Transcript_18786/g.38533  ORF Transcript_18786/g.38533 Transcript_18786/m.38533 type:complete len:181 (+) Transcript_18786:103-645(+)|eukprot:CAMPEP_0201125946 /NCGR_PEP_ID=MMETSP0850-20130426/23882_1 /ASSEMBLY_ACC=CAM_ASM_000622 /TAXON_ID=183588 /ORGANISM="Pseudo-nitzschia fraudulenta, Strain WWA7" /LENGTH=180 /DNA_ID=CAMNT_0047394165 /DNA_START=88 /DNA_END=630 /DNA_ORIENTATION=+